ncbi:DUF2341 domain-containing protein [Luteibaculum oceani]|uniref:DUF2341 domain-containing protein n=1 Tax=Luteibaculum oceani TaxID=1294296 RepID=A0A5C6VE65_9FLAO|nr:DUF2341 domain-containing protein [Luteibaculum oceani]TXC81348.1 DUF2341 domain-containing protein [Luteibaculum oceani]
MRFILATILFCFSVTVFGQLDAWKWRKQIKIENKSNSEDIEQSPVFFVLNGADLEAAGKIRSDYGDLRVSIDCDGDSLLNYWIENPTGGNNTIVWAYYPDTIRARSEITLYVFYGNSAATSAEDFDATFPTQAIYDEDGTLPDVTDVDWFEVQPGVTLTGASATIVYNITAARVKIDGTIDLTGLGEQQSVVAPANGTGTGGDGFGGGGGGYGADGAPGFDADNAGDPGAPGTAQGDRKAVSLDTAHAGGNGFVGIADPLGMGNDQQEPTFAGGNGGGAIRIRAAFISINELIVDGANGEGANQGGAGIPAGTAFGGNPPNGSGGGGAGGGALLQAALIDITGDLSADGGDGGEVPGTSEGTGGGGGGGRVKIFSDTLNISGLVSAYGGLGGLLGNGQQGTPPNNGDTGTVYIDSATIHAAPVPTEIFDTRNGVDFIDAMAPNYVECRGVNIDFTTSKNFANYQYFINNELVQSSGSNVMSVDTFSVDPTIHVIATAGVCINYSDTIVPDILTGPYSEFFPAGFNLTYNFQNLSKDATSYLWDFGDGSTSTQFEPTYKYGQPDTVTACLTAFNPGLQCQSHISCQEIIIECNPPRPGFTNSNNGLRVNFLDLSDFTTTWLWDFGDGNTSTQKSPVHEYISPGTYTVTVTYKNECGTVTFSKNITVDCNFNASFTSQKIGNTLEVKFTNTTPGAHTTNWEFGDGTQTTGGKTVSHKYIASGSYNVCMTSISQCGATVDCQLLSFSCNKPSVDFTFTTQDTNATFTSTVTGNLGDITWDFGDGTTTNILNPTHAYEEDGVYNVCLTAQNDCGRVTRCKEVAATCDDPAASFDFVTSDGYTYSFGDSSLNAVKWRWELGPDRVVSNQQHPTYTYRNDTTRSYVVCLTIFNTCGESDRVCKTINVKCLKPTVGFTYTIDDTTVTFTSSVKNQIGGVNWTFGDGGKSNHVNPVYSYSGEGEYEVCITATNKCATVSHCETVVISCNDPVARFNKSTADGFNYSFRDSSINAEQWFWDFGIAGETSTLRNPTYSYKADSTARYRACLTVFNGCGEAKTNCQFIFVTDSTTVGIDLFELGMLEVYPNPNNGRITLNNIGEITGDLQLRNVLGQIVRRRAVSGESNVELEFYDQPEGVYLVDIIAENGARGILRIVKQ